MFLHDRYDGRGDPFEGDRELCLRRIPAGARIVSARVVVEPLRGEVANEPFAETLCFDDATGTGDWGATKTTVEGQPGWVEVDFHRRRTLAGVAGSQLEGSTLQVDMGGSWVEINSKGAFLAPNTDDVFSLGGDNVPLPGLTVLRFKLTQGTKVNNESDPSAGESEAPDITAVTVRSTPSNVSLGLGGLSPFWIHPGEHGRRQTTPDFGQVLQAFLTAAKVEDGFYTVPLVAHSDTIARLALTFELEVQLEQAVLPEGLTDLGLLFDYGGIAKADDGVLELNLPPGARIVESSGRAMGAFAETRVVHGPIGRVASTETVAISASFVQAQPIVLDHATSASAVDLLLAAVSSKVRLQLDLRNDADGKPGHESLLSAPVELGLARATAGRPTWTSHKLPEEVELADGGAIFWLVLQSLEGEAGWIVERAETPAPALQNSPDTVAWRQTLRPSNGDPATALFRLRRRPERFEMPIELQVGEGDSAQRLGLERFAAQSRVDLALDLPELAGSVNDHLAKVSTTTTPAIPDSEHLANGDFEQWIQEGDGLGEPRLIKLDEGQQPRVVRVSPDGRWAYILSTGSNKAVLQAIDLQAIDLYSSAPPGDVWQVEYSKDDPLSLALGADGSRAYAVVGTVIHEVQIPGGEAGMSFDIAAFIASFFNNETTKSKIASVDVGRFLDIQSAALSLGDRRLYIGINNKTEVADLHLKNLPKFLVVLGFDTMLLRDPQLEEDRGSSGPSVFFCSLHHHHRALSISPGGDRLHLLLGDDGQGRSAVYSLDEPAFAKWVSRDSRIWVGQDCTAMALFQGGSKAVVTDRGVNGNGEHSVHIVDMESLEVVASVPVLGGVPRAVAVEPDGRRAFVATEGANGEGGALLVIDLAQDEEPRAVPLVLTGTPPDFLDVAVSPLGDRVVALSKGPSNGTGQVHILPIGESLPEEWQPTGRVWPLVRHDDPRLHRIAAFAGDDGSSVATSLSQVVPVVPGIAYELTFYATASESGAVAELLWLNDGQGMVAVASLPFQVGAAIDSWIENAPLLPHRLRTPSPTTATQVQVRFTVPGGQVLLDRVSLRATGESLANTTLQPSTSKVPEGWSLVPDDATGLRVEPLERDGGVKLTNEGIESVTLAQTLGVEGGRPFELLVQGHNTAQGDGVVPGRVEVRWLAADGAVAGTPTVFELTPGGLDQQTASGRVPAEAVRAEVALELRAGAELELGGVSLHFPETVRVPISVLSQAPGELAVSDWRVVYDVPEVPPPPAPATGLHPPLPPEHQSGEPTPDGSDPHCSCHCRHCGCQKDVEEATPAVTEAGRPVQVGSCSSCGRRLVRPGGPLVPGAPRLQVRRLPSLRQQSEKRASHRPMPRMSRAPSSGSEIGALLEQFAAMIIAPPTPIEEPIPLTQVPGVGTRRAEHLRQLGIDSVAKLADAEVVDLCALPGLLGEKAAGRLITEARHLMTPR